MCLHERGEVWTFATYTSSLCVLPRCACRNQRFAMVTHNLSVGGEGQEMYLATRVSRFVQPDLAQTGNEIATRLRFAQRLRLPRPFAASSCSCALVSASLAV